MDAEDLPDESRAIRRVADLRYPRQNYELSVNLPERPMDSSALAQLIGAFHALHDQAYGFASPGEQVQFVTLRLEAIGHVPTVELPRIPPAVGDVSTARLRDAQSISVTPWGEVQCPVYERKRLSVRPHPARARSYRTDGHDHTRTSGSIDTRVDSLRQSPHHRARLGRALGPHARSNHGRSHWFCVVVDRRRDGQCSDTECLLDKHQGTPRLLDRTLRRPRANSRPSYPHPDPSRVFNGDDPRDRQAVSSSRHLLQATSSSPMIPLRVEARTLTTSSWYRRSASMIALWRL